MRAAVVAESLFSSFEVYPRQPHHLSIADHTGAIFGGGGRSVTSKAQCASALRPSSGRQRFATPAVGPAREAGP